MASRTLYDKIFDNHTIREVFPGTYQVFVGLHLIHEATSPQAFAMLEDRGMSVLMPERTFATVDHVNSTRSLQRPYPDPLSEAMHAQLTINTEKHDIRLFEPAKGEHGIVHVIGPEYGLTQPGITLACGDSHTSTHGAFGALAFGIGTSQIRDVLAAQSLLMRKLKVRRINVNGRLKNGVRAKDVILYIIHKLGTKAGIGFAYEFGGETVDHMTMDQRMTLCNMAIEANARCAYMNPDQTAYDYLKGRPFAPSAENWDKAVAYWNSVKSDSDAEYDDVVDFDANDIEPMLTWGTQLDQSMPVNGTVPDDMAFEDDRAFMGFRPGQKLIGEKIDFAFIGSCTNGRFSDFEEVGYYLKKTGLKVPDHVAALIVPGSQNVRNRIIETGLDKVFLEANFQLREAGCSMCMALNDDRLQDGQLCASSSNRNFRGRQGAPRGKTLIMSPVMVAACAVAGQVADPRKVFDIDDAVYAEETTP